MIAMDFTERQLNLLAACVDAEYESEQQGDTALSISETASGGISREQLRQDLLKLWKLLTGRS